MTILGLLAATACFIAYFCLKYTYAWRANSYSIQLTWREVWRFSFDGHPMRRSVVPVKYVGIFFMLMGLAGWKFPLHPEDVKRVLLIPVVILIHLNYWARLMIYESTHWKKGPEKSMPGIAAFVMFQRSINEIGWFPPGGNWLSKIIVVTNVLLLFFFIAITAFQFI